MPHFGLFYEGVRWDIPSEGGSACLSFLSSTQRLFETLIFTFFYGGLFLWCFPELKLPVDKKYPPHKRFAWITMMHCLVFGIEIGYKLTARSLIFILNPCHVLTIIQLWLLFAKPSSFVTAVFRLHLHGINGTLLALLLPTTGTREPALRIIYFIQHILILVIPACILDQNSVYSIEPLGDFHWVLTSLAIQTLYHFLLLQPLGVLTQVNLNQMLCPSPSDPFAGTYYRIAAMVHQPLLIIFLGKFYSIVVLWLQQSIKSPDFLKALCSSFHWLPGVAIISRTSNLSTTDQRVGENSVERRPHSLKELFQVMPPVVTTGDQFKLSNPPTDTISAVHFQPGKGSQFLLASSWDCTVRLYDVTSGGQRSSYDHACPVLASCFTDALHAVSGSLEGAVKYYDVNTSQVMNLGKCNRAVSVALYSQAIGAPLTGSWDKTVRVWDPRAISAASAAGDTAAGGAVSVHQQPDSVFTMDAVNTTLVIGTAGRQVLLWDLRNMAQPIEQQESTLRYQTRIIRCFPNGQGFVMGSIEGRVAVRMFDKSQESQKKSYVFKCHRKREENREIIYPVTAISFHQRYNTFATGGSDGMVNTWDGFNRKWLAQFEKYPTTISSLDFCEDGTQLAISVSYLYENGDIPDPPTPAIYIRSVADSEVRRKNLAPVNSGTGGATISAPSTVPPTRY